MDKDELFTIGQAAKCCGLSRSTVMRLEEKGLIKPAYCDDSTGYRYYDADGISRLLHIDFMHGLELKYDQILQYYKSGGDVSDLLLSLEEKYYSLKRTLDELHMRVGMNEELRPELLTIPDQVCYTKEFNRVKQPDMGVSMRETFIEAVKRGLSLLGGEPYFIILKQTEFTEGQYATADYDYTCCIPLRHENAPEDAVKIPGGLTLSVMSRGGYDRCSEALAYLQNMKREYGIKPAGYPRGLSLVAPYVGAELTPDKYVTRFVIPIDEDNLEHDLHVLKK